MIFHRLIRRFVQKYRLNDEKMLHTELGTFGEDARVCYPFTIFPKDTIHIGARTLIMPDVRLQTYYKLTGIHSKIVIGKDCYIGYRFCCLGGQDVIIDDMNTISSDVCIVSENHGFNPEDPVIYGDQPLDCGTVHICEGCWIGEQVIVLPGITIGKRSVVGAGSIVTKDIPDYSLAVGNPARVIKQYNFETHQWERV